MTVVTRCPDARAGVVGIGGLVIVVFVAAEALLADETVVVATGVAVDALHIMNTL